MPKIARVMENVPVAQLYWSLMQRPELWNQRTARTEHPDSPHHGCDDIWLRFGQSGEGEDALRPHDAVWYPEAADLGVKPLCYDLMRFAMGDELGGVLLTRVPAWHRVEPHVDNGWHAKRYEKFAVQIAAAPGQRFCFEDEELESKPGDVYWFDNQHTHWVENPTPYERVTLIVCIRKEGLPCRG